MWNLLDVLAFVPPLVEAFLMHGAHVTWFTFGRFDFRWFKILRWVWLTKGLRLSACLLDLAAPLCLTLSLLADNECSQQQSD